VALGAYHAAKKVGISIPHDIGIVAYGFNDIAQTFTPPLSVINQNPRGIGLTAAKMLIEEIEQRGNHLGKNVIIEEEFVWNASIIRKRLDND
jgi:DNA-binding LacI/PurR family transcriptional regulator